VLREVLGRVDTQALVRDATRHGLPAVLSHELTQAGVSLPAEEARALRMAASAVVGSALRVRTLMVRVLEAFAREGLTPVLLKGYGFGARYYPEPALRAMSDVDVLIPRESLPKAERALTGLGLGRTEEAHEAYALEHHHHLEFQSQSGLVELHFRALVGFGATLQAEPLFERAREATLEGHKVRYLRPEDELVYLAAHAAGHLLLRLGWLYDLKLLLLQTPSLDWDAVVSVARAARMQSPVYLALRAARDAFGAQVPEAALAALRPPSWQEALFQRLFSPEVLVEAPLADRKWSRYAVLPFLASGPREGAAYALHHLQRGLKRKVAFRLPGLAPTSWRG
jgi:hypothetical protein